MVENSPAMQETWVQSPGWQDPLEKGTANHASVLAWEMPWTEEPGGLPSKGLQRIRHNVVTKQQQQTDLNGLKLKWGQCKISMY